MPSHLFFKKTHCKSTGYVLKTPVLVGIGKNTLDEAEKICTGARKCKRACIGHRQERPATDSPTVEPTQRRCSDCGKECANVTGKSAQADGMHPSWALGLDSTEVASRWSRETFYSHPAVSMERQEGTA